MRSRHPSAITGQKKKIVIAGDDDHRIENNPGREKASAAAEAVAGVAIFPNLSAEQREQGMTDFNDLARANPELVSRQLANVLQQTRQRTLDQSTSIELTASGKGVFSTRPGYMANVNAQERSAHEIGQLLTMIDEESNKLEQKYAAVAEDSYVTRREYSEAIGLLAELKGEIEHGKRSIDLYSDWKGYEDAAPGEYREDRESKETALYSIRVVLEKGKELGFQIRHECEQEWEQDSRQPSQQTRLNDSRGLSVENEQSRCIELT